jgi:hypothetical protein
MSSPEYPLRHGHPGHAPCHSCAVRTTTCANLSYFEGMRAIRPLPWPFGVRKLGGVMYRYPPNGGCEARQASQFRPRHRPVSLDFGTPEHRRLDSRRKARRLTGSCHYRIRFGPCRTLHQEGKRSEAAPRYINLCSVRHSWNVETGGSSGLGEMGAGPLIETGPGWLIDYRGRGRRPPSPLRSDRVCPAG